MPALQPPNQEHHSKLLPSSSIDVLNANMFEDTFLNHPTQANTQKVDQVTSTPQPTPSQANDLFTPSFADDMSAVP